MEALNSENDVVLGVVGHLTLVRFGKDHTKLARH